MCTGHKRKRRLPSADLALLLCLAVNTGPLWQEYINFLSGPKPGTSAYQALWSAGVVGGQEESTKTAALR